MGHDPPPLPVYDPGDYWAERDGHAVAVIEVKAYDREVGASDHTMMSLRKYLALLMASTTGVRGLYVVRFGDAIRWVDVAMVDTIGRVTSAAGRIGGGPPMGSRSSASQSGTWVRCGERSTAANGGHGPRPHAHGGGGGVAHHPPVFLVVSGAWPE